MNEYIDTFHRQYGNNWPQAALERLIQLAGNTFRSELETKMFLALREWAEETILAGVAFQQKAF